MNLHQWLRSSFEDADRRGLSSLKPLLEGFFKGTEELRAADWGDDLAAELLRQATRAGQDLLKGSESRSPR